jgi:hypothetical protein
MIMKRILLLFVFATWSLFLFWFGWTVKAPVIVEIPPPYKLRADVLWETVNDWKVSQKTKPYVLNDSLCEIADKRLRETSVDWSHNKFYDVTDEIYKKTDEFTGLGENLARNFQTETSVLTGWLNSPGHRRNLEANYTDSCIATDGIHVVKFFGKK